MQDILKDLIQKFMPFAQKEIGFEKPPRLFLRRDEENAKNPLGKTAFYDPSAQSVTLYVTGRHPKDILRSLGHELVHHKQNCDGEFEDAGEMGEGYAQKNPHLRRMEEDANQRGSMCLRDFEDKLKKENTIYYEHLQKGDNKMSTKDWKNEELRTILSEAWGFKFNTLQEFDEFSGNGEIQAEGEEEEIEELAQAGRTERPRQPRMQRKVADSEEDDEKKVAEGEDHDDEEAKMDERRTGRAGPRTRVPDTRQRALEEGDDGESAGDKGKDKDDPEAKDYTDGGDRKGDDSKTHKGEKDDTLKEAIAAVLRKHLQG
tara:strand:+ start:2379 stop:3326 length:948 start_codon:yes stop_codon:yes gene_type:complete